MIRTCRMFASLVWLGWMASLTGCQARQMVNHYLSFDSQVTELYEKHVLYNLARRDNGRTMVQMDYKAFSASLSSNLGTSGQIRFFANPTNKAGDGASISLNTFQQAFEPNINSSTATSLNIASAPAEHQDAIRALYDEQVNRPEDTRIFRRTSSTIVAMHSYCWVRTDKGEIYYVPQGRHREFADFVHKVSFYRPAPPPSAPPAAPAQPTPQQSPMTAPATAPTQPAATQPTHAAAPAATQPLSAD